MQLVLTVPCCGTQAGLVAAALWGLSMLGWLTGGSAGEIQPHTELGVSHTVPQEWLMDALFSSSYTTCSPLIPDWRSFMPTAVTSPEAAAGKCSM